MSALAKRLDELDALTDRRETYEPLVRDELMYSLEIGDVGVTRQFLEWLADDPLSFLEQTNNPGERTHKEIVWNHRLRWVNAMLSEHGYEQVDRLYGLGVCNDV